MTGTMSDCQSLDNSETGTRRWPVKVSKKARIEVPLTVGLSRGKGSERQYAGSSSFSWNVAEIRFSPGAKRMLHSA